MSSSRIDINAIDTIRAYYMPDDSDMPGGVPAPLIIEPRCKLCNHPQRIWVENAVHEGYTPNSIIANLEDPESLKHWNIRDHFKAEHVFRDKAYVLEVAWKRAEEQGITIEEYRETQESHVEALQLVVDKFLWELRSPGFLPDMKDGLAAIKLQHELKTNEGDGTFSGHEMYVTLSLFMRHVFTILTEYVPRDREEAMDSLRALLARDPILKNLAGKVEKSDDLPELIDAEVVEAEVVEEAPAPYVPVEGWHDDSFIPDA